MLAQINRCEHLFREARKAFERLQVLGVEGLCHSRQRDQCAFLSVGQADWSVE